MGKCLFMRKGETHTAPSVGIMASDIAVGSSVYLMENGSPVEYLVVNQGIPYNSSLYDSSCDGTWLVRKALFPEKQRWNGSGVHGYHNSEVCAYLTNTFINQFDDNVKSQIKTVKIPYVSSYSGPVIQSGSDGLSTKLFLLSACEVGWRKSDSNGGYLPIDGAILSYFEEGSSGNTKRIARLNGSGDYWWLRSQGVGYPNNPWGVTNSGECGLIGGETAYGTRPAMILPFNALFDEETLILK